MENAFRLLNECGKHFLYARVSGHGCVSWLYNNGVCRIVDRHILKRDISHTLFRKSTFRNLRNMI